MFMPLCRLLRLPALFTTFPDVLAGYAIVTQGVVEPVALSLLLASSACLYLAGMVLNDYFDLEQDRKERPQRPIPAGEISSKFACVLGFGLIAAGLGFAAAVGTTSLITAAVLAGVILAYDAGGKRTALGPILMGSCRTTNLLLGASALGESALLWKPPTPGAALLIGIYVVGITVFARSEAAESSKSTLRVGIGICLIALVGWGALAAGFSSPAAMRLVGIMLFLITFQVLRRAWPAISACTPDRIQQTVKVMLLTIPMLEAVVIVAHGGQASLPLAIAAALMMVPGQILARFIPMT